MAVAGRPVGGGGGLRDLDPGAGGVLGGELAEGVPIRRVALVRVYFHRLTVLIQPPPTCVIPVLVASCPRRSGTIDIEELVTVECNAMPGAGACGGMFTANTMAASIEALGMSLPYGGSKTSKNTST